MTGSDDLHQLWRHERARLLGLATTMLRDRAAAEDVVQEAFARFSARRESDASAPGRPIVENPGAWLSVVTGNLCLDLLKSASRRRELLSGDDIVLAVGGAAPDPADRVTLDDQVRQAMLVVLDRLNPEERVSFVLHDVFGLRFAEIAEAVGSSEANSRQLAHRARGKLAGRPPTGASPASPRPDLRTGVVIERFVAACQGGSLDALIAELRPDAWGIATTLDGELLQRNDGSETIAANLLRFLAPPTVLVIVNSTVHAFRGLRWFARIDLDLADQAVQSLTATVDTRVRTPLDAA